jgi:uncharacterized protein (TIGR02265 family)
MACYAEPSPPWSASLQSRIENERAAVLEEASVYCDILTRRELVPHSAKVRGVYFQSIEGALRKAGKLERYKALCPESFATALWHPCTDFLEQLVIGGALLRGPEGVHAGMFDIGRHNTVAFAGSLLGRLLLRVLSRDPKRLLEQGASARRQGSAYGQWSLTFLSDHSAVVEMRDEYAYIESYLLGAAKGMFETIAVPARVEAELDSAFNGRHILRWEPKSG